MDEIRAHTPKSTDVAAQRKRPHHGITSPEYATPTLPAKFRKSPASVVHLGDKTIKLIVGPDKVPIAVHEIFSERCQYDILVPVREQITEISLPRETPECIDHYVNFLYTGQVVTHTSARNNSSTAIKKELDFLADLYLVGFRFLNSGFKNAVLDAIIRTSSLKDEKGQRNLPREDFVCLDSLYYYPARQCVIDLYANFADVDRFCLTSLTNAHLLRDILTATLRKCDVQSEEGSFRGRSLKPCDYHEHPAGVRCDAQE